MEKSIKKLLILNSNGPSVYRGAEFPVYPRGLACGEPSTANASDEDLGGKMKFDDVEALRKNSQIYEQAPIPGRRRRNYFI
jgi:hypothetical protein